MSDFLIIGGGVIGLLLTRELAIAGAKVTLIERGECGREASWAGGGIVSPLYPWRYSQAVTALASAAQKTYPDLAKVLLEDTGIDPEYERTGLLMLDAEDTQEALQWARHTGNVMTPLSSADIHEREARLASGFRQGLWMPDIANIRNPRLLKALLCSLEKQPNVRILTQSKVTRFLGHPANSPHQLLGVEVLQDGKANTVLGDHIVVTAGAWTGDVLKPLGVQIRVEPVKGQMLLLKPKTPVVHSMVLTKGRYLIPRRDQQLLVGSTLEYTGYDKSTTEEALQSLHASALELVPELEGAPILKQWAGLRPGTEKGIPYIGSVPGFENLSVNAGQFRNGLVLAPASTGLLADILLGRTPRLDPMPYRVPGELVHTVTPD